MSKRLPEATKNYSITELEMCGLAINIASFVHLLKKAAFDAIVNHLAIMHIMKSKVEPATTRIKEIVRTTELLLFQCVLHKRKGHGFEVLFVQTKNR